MKQYEIIKLHIPPFLHCYVSQHLYLFVANPIGKIILYLTFENFLASDYGEIDDIPSFLRFSFFY